MESSEKLACVYMASETETGVAGGEEDGYLVETNEKSHLMLIDGACAVEWSGSGEYGCHTVVPIPGNAYGVHKLGAAKSCLESSCDT